MLNGRLKRNYRLHSNEEWNICIGELERTLPLFPCLRQLETNRYDLGASLISIDLVASISSLPRPPQSSCRRQGPHQNLSVATSLPLQKSNIFCIGDGLPSLIHLELNGYDGSLTNRSIAHLSKLSNLRSFELTTYNQSCYPSQPQLANFSCVLFIYLPENTVLCYIHWLGMKLFHSLQRF